MTLNTYAHVFDEFALAGRGSAEEEILRARGEDVPVLYPPAPQDAALHVNPLQIPSGRCPARTGDLLLVRQAL